MKASYQSPQDRVPDCSWFRMLAGTETGADGWATLGEPVSCANATGTGCCSTTRVRVPLQPLEISPHLRRALIAQVAVFLQSFVDDIFQFGRKVGVQALYFPRERQPGIVALMASWRKIFYRATHET